MPHGRPNGFGAPRLGVMALWAALALATPSRASAEALADPPERLYFSIGLLAGSTQFDAGLADYQWDTTPRPGWGLKGLAGRGRFAAGLRLWRASSTQAIGDLGAAPHVHTTSWELVGEGRLAEVQGIQVQATAGAGRLHLGYDPDQITIQPPGSPSPIVVNLAPVGTWIGGGGLALRREVAPAWTVGLGLDARVFAMDTAHRSGNEIVYARESFSDWSARLELAWRVGAMKGTTR